MIPQVADKPAPATASSRRETTWAQCFAAFALVAVTYFLLRSTLPNYVFDDTRHMYHGHEAYYSNPTAWGTPFDSWNHTLWNEFKSDPTREYRPLSFFQHAMGVSAYGRDLDEKPWASIIIVSVGIGLCALAFFSFAHYFLQSGKWAAAACLLFFTSMPVVTGSWILIMGWQWMVSLMLLAGLIGYLRYKQTGHLRWLALFWFAYLIGPWFREFAGMGVFVVTANEIFFCRNRSRAVLGSCALLSLHVIFPAFLANLLTGMTLNDLAFTPVYKLGPLGSLTSKGSSLLRLENLRMDALYHYIFLFPPILWVLLLAAVCLGIHQFKTRKEPGIDARGNRLAAVIAEMLRYLTIVLILVLVYYSIKFVFNEDYALRHAALPLLLVSLTAAMAARYSALLAIYALLSLLPFLKVYTEEVHLAYAVAPMSIIFMLYIRELFGFLRDRVPRPLGRVGTALAAILLSIGLADASLNVLGSYLTVRGIYAGTRDKARWLKENAHQGSIVVGNFIDLRDMLLYAVQHYEPYFTITPHWEPNHVKTGHDLAKLLDRLPEHKDVYVVGANFERAPGKYVYHTNHFVGVLAEYAQVKKQFKTRIIYPYLDPLKYFVPDALTSFAGPPDLVDDYWVGRDKKKRLFLRECRTDYLLVKTDRENDAVRGRVECVAPVPCLAEEGYKGYNIIVFEGKAYAIQQNAGAFDRERARSAGAGGYIVGLSVADVKERITKAVASMVPRGAQPSDGMPGLAARPQR